MRQSFIGLFLFVFALSGCGMPQIRYTGSKETVAAFGDIVRCAEKNEKDPDCGGKYKGATFVAEAWEQNEKGEEMAIKAHVASTRRWFVCFADRKTQEPHFQQLTRGTIFKFKGNPGQVATAGPNTAVAIDKCTIESIISTPPKA